MTFLKNPILCLVVSSVACATTGCQDDPAKHGGTYTAARHMRTDSHIPQSDDVMSRTAVYKPAAGEETVNGYNGAGGMNNAAGGGR